MPFCIRPVARLATKTMNIKNPKYRRAEVVSSVDRASNVKHMILMHSDEAIR